MAGWRTAYGTKEFIRAELPSYEPPPPWEPTEQRQGNPLYDNDLRQFLPHPVTVQRSTPTDTLGFNIRGGAEHGFGIYISKVMPHTEAEAVGLREGDQILSVNDVSFENIGHPQAVVALKETSTINLVVRFFPFAYMKTYKKVNMVPA
ncbi:PDZ domain-containing protein 11 [Lamellibrachia satsuma]|nr:PDZ domain-containing protein 11 [Lamellibrachia satsuma]